jgi:alcohol dehydrogenase class IV
MGLDVELHLPPDIQVGGGVSERAGELAKGIGLSRVLVVTDPVMVDSGVAGGVTERLEAAGIPTATFSDIRGEPTTDYVDAGVAALRAHEADGVLAVGGGSPLDTAKAISVMATNGGPLPEYLGYHKIPEPGLPLIAVPTTAGTGSEVTRVTVITDTSRDVKMMILSNHLMPRVALADYKLTLTCPPGLTANVGVDSLTHAIESYVSAKANPVTDLLALRAAALIGQNLRRAQRDGGDEEAREALMLGAMLAGAAFSNASVALVHGMSRPIGAHFHVPHGLSNAVLLPTITRWSVGGARARYATIARHMGLADAGSSDEDATARLVDELDALNADLGVPRLGELDGVDREHFDRVKAEMAEAALASGSPGFNPRVPTAEEIVALYDAAW